MENLSQEEFDQICKELVEKPNLISKENLKNLKKLKSKLIIFLVPLLIFICKSAGPSFLIPKSDPATYRAPFASMSTVALSTKKTTPDSLKSNQLAKVQSATSKQSISFAISKTVTVEVGRDKKPTELKISQYEDKTDSTNNTVSVYGTSSRYCDKKSINKAIKKEVKKIPDYNLLQFEWDHGIVKPMGIAINARSSFEKIDTSVVYAVPPIINKLTAQEKHYLPERIKYPFSNGLTGLVEISMDKSMAEVDYFIQTDSGARILVPYEYILKNTSLQQRRFLVTKVQEFVERSQASQDHSLLFFERLIRRTHLEAEHQAIRVEAPEKPIEEVIEIMSEISVRNHARDYSLLHSMPDKNSRAALELKAMADEERLSNERTIRALSMDLQNKIRSPEARKKLEKFQQNLDRSPTVPTKILSLEEISEMNIEDEIYSSQGRQGREYSNLSKKKT